MLEFYKIFCPSLDWRITCRSFGSREDVAGETVVPVMISEIRPMRCMKCQQPNTPCLLGEATLQALRQAKIGAA